MTRTVTTNRQMIEILEQMKEVNAALALTRADYEEKRAAIMAIVQVDLDALQDEYQPLIDAAQSKLSELESNAKTAVIARGESVKIDGLSISFVKGRVSWDTKALDGYAAAHPEIEQFCKVTAVGPSVSLKVVDNE